MSSKYGFETPQDREEQRVARQQAGKRVHLLVLDILADFGHVAGVSAVPGGEPGDWRLADLEITVEDADGQPGLFVFAGGGVFTDTRATQRLANVLKTQTRLPTRLAHGT